MYYNCRFFVDFWFNVYYLPDKDTGTQHIILQPQKKKEENAAASADRLGNEDSGSVDYRSRNFDFTCVYESALISIIFHHKNKK